ncbi:hypothetical protein LY76DRAFT_360774 [Colletotrichum caudatum]|nr:hypothetical protein LY76DRAFT_360774 [Colletotrichum caudatum]
MFGYTESSHLALRSVVVEMAQHHATAAGPKLNGTVSAYHDNVNPSPQSLPAVFRLCPRRTLFRIARGPCNIAIRPSVQSGTSRAQTRQRQSPILSLPAPPPPPPPPPPHAAQALDQAQKKMAATILLVLFASLHHATLNTTKGQEQEGGRRPAMHLSSPGGVLSGVQFDRGPTEQLRCSCVGACVCMHVRVWWV